MSTRLKVIIWGLMVVGFIFGYAGLVIPGQTAILETPEPGTVQFQRLHIFLFNLVSGGTLLLLFTEESRKLTRRATLYIVAALAFSLAAFLNAYLPAVILALFLAVLVESLRIKRFSFWPGDFFDYSVPVARKFHHAALLCLSLGLLICAGVMLDNQVLHLFHIPLLLLDDFFLGFSFPLSLITFSMMFAMTKQEVSPGVHLAREASFWIVTVGVIIFFVFIIFEIALGELIMSLLLLGDVIIIYILFRAERKRSGEAEDFLTSGMAFLVLTGITGLLLVLWGILTPTDQKGYDLLLQTHAYLSLYGWNLAGLSVLVHYTEFPLRLHELEIILLHWVTVALLAPLGSMYPIFAIAAVPAFMLLIGLIMFSQPLIATQPMTELAPVEEGGGTG